MMKPVILLALVLGTLASVQAANMRQLLGGTTTGPYTCAAGTEFDGNNRPGTLPSCNSGDYTCATSSSSDCSGTSCDATCCLNGNCFTMTVLTGSASGTTGYSFSFQIGSTAVSLSSIYQLYLKGGNAYCYIASPGSAVYTPYDTSNGTPKALSHADFCYIPCKCTDVTWSTIADQTLCPGDALPDKSTYTATDNCGNSLDITVSDASNVDSTYGCGTITRTLSVDCNGNTVTKTQTFTITDSGVTFDTCGTAHSTCLSSISLADPTVDYNKEQCSYSFTRTANNACGVQSTDVKTCSPF